MRELDGEADTEDVDALEHACARVRAGGSEGERWGGHALERACGGCAKDAN